MRAFNVTLRQAQGDCHGELVEPCPIMHMLIVAFKYRTNNANKRTFNMKRKLYILHAILSAIIYFSLLSPVFGGEKSVIIGFHEKTGPSEQALIHDAKGIIKRTFRLIPAMAVSMPEEEIAKIKKNNKVAYVENDSIVTAVEPLIGDEYANSWGVQHIGSDVAHASGNKGLGVKIAVLDTGIDYTHEDLDGNYKGGYNFVEYIDYSVDPYDPFDDSWNSHGTHVAGIIAAEQNDNGVVGVAPEADLYAVKVLDASGHGLTSWVISGIQWAVDNKMDIVNISIQVGEDSPSLRATCNAAYDAGLLLVAAAGNTYGGEVTDPAAYDSVIAVTATTIDDMRSNISPISPKVELASPGVNILSTVRGGNYDSLSGTSQAAPHVAGTAALIISSGNAEDLNNDGEVNNKDIRLKLRMTAIDLGDTGFDTVYGFGLVNAAEAVLLENDTEYLTIIKTSKPAFDAKTVSLSSGLYQVTIENNGLNIVRVKVSEGGVFLKNLSSIYSFNRKRPQKVTFNLDVTSTYEATFIPYGKNGSSANITIKKN
jgi:subtilisin family serine protease